MERGVGWRGEEGGVGNMVERRRGLGGEEGGEGKRLERGVGWI